MRIGAVSTFLTLVFVGSASAQTYATSEQPYAPSVPVYEAYKPNTFDAGAYEAAAQPETVAPPIEVPLPQAQATVGGLVSVPRSSDAPIFYAPAPLPPTPILQVQPITGQGGFVVAPNDPSLGDNLSLPLGTPETFASSEPAPRGELGFSQESETSRLLIALEKTYATRVSEMKVKHLAQRRAMLDAFEREASDPNKVIGLAGRMRTGLAELEAVQAEALALEEQQYTAAMLSVLDRAPSRAE